MKHKILFLAADSLRSDRTAFDLEAREIQVEIDRSAHRDRFELVTRWAAQPLDLLRELRRVEPTIVHVCGHGGSPRMRVAATVWRWRARPTARASRRMGCTFRARMADRSSSRPPLLPKRSERPAAR